MEDSSSSDWPVLLLERPGGPHAADGLRPTLSLTGESPEKEVEHQKVKDQPDPQFPDMTSS